MHNGWARAVHKTLICHLTGPVEMHGSVLVYPVKAVNLTETFDVQVRHCLPRPAPGPACYLPSPDPCPVLAHQRGRSRLCCIHAALMPMHT